MPTTSLSAEIARNVRASMRAVRISQAQLVERTGISERTLKRRLTGKSAWTTDELDLIASGLTTPEHTVTVSDLLRVTRSRAA